MKFPHGPVVRVQCKKETITKAVTANSSKCWIAESIKDQFPKAAHVAVDLSTTRFTDPERGLRYVYNTPYAAQLAIIAFDEGTPPEPFAFTLRNAHVTRANCKPKVAIDPKHNTRQDRKNAAKRVKRAKHVQQTLAGPAFLRTNSQGGPHSVRRLGGRRPPQLRMLRQFGIRAFRGASKKRLEADAALIARADE
jgi:hypothetical protein